MRGKRRLHIFSLSAVAVLLTALLLPLGVTGRVAAAVLLPVAAVAAALLLAKRSPLSIYKGQVLLILTVAALMYVMLFYLTGLPFGFFKNPYRLTAGNFTKFFLPIAAAIIGTEVLRYVLMAQRDKLTDVLCYIACVLAEVLVCATLPSVTSFAHFMDLAAGALFPALTGNLFYNYISRRYGVYPTLVFRLITTLHAYLFPITSGISQALLHFFNMMLPLALYLFVDALYEKKKRYARGKTTRAGKALSAALTAVVLVLMTGAVMLTSNQFRYGSLVIATESMTGELNKGDIALFETYDDQTLQEGQVIVYANNKSMIVHRIVNIEIINGLTRYYTRGDANEDNDIGYRTDGDIVGIVGYKLPYFGYPTLWLRSLFKR